MAYPFTQMPTVGEFLAKAVSYGVVVATPASEVVGPRGKINLRYARRGDGPPVIIPGQDDERLTPTALSNLCRQLSVPPDEFGLAIGGITLDTHREES
jgi:hypothetical protein